MLSRPKMVKNKFGKSTHRTEGETDFVADKKQVDDLKTLLE